MKLAYYFEPASGSRGGPWELKGQILKVVVNIDYKTLEQKTTPVWNLIRENEVRFGIRPLALISADPDSIFNTLTKKYEESLLILLKARDAGTKNAHQWTIKDISDRTLGWGLGW